jgi:hypothetical protein
MNEFDKVPLEIQASDLLEQIVKVNRMVDLHAEDPFMREEYQALKRDFMQQLNTVLRELRLQLTELAA